MIVVDSYGWLEYFADSDRAELFRPALEEKKGLIVPSICVLEVAKVLLRERSRDIALRCIAGMRSGRCIDLDESLAIAAATIATTLKMPTADSIVLATAQRFGATVWTPGCRYRGQARG